MKYYIKERKVADETAKTAWSKARNDVEQICAGEGYESIAIVPEVGDRVNMGVVDKLKAHVQMRDIWQKQLSELKSGDMILIQLPAINNCIFLSKVLKKVKNKNVKIIGLVHDLESLRMSITGEVSFRSKMRMRIEEISVLKLCDKLIVHNDKMLGYMKGLGFDADKMVSLQIFDYLMPDDVATKIMEKGTPERYASLIVAGNLSPEKAGYVYKMPERMELLLYGVFYKDDGKRNLDYKGSFEPELLPENLEGGFGLVWDGTSIETCSGVYGEYLRYNNPHKTSLYFASGIPVVIWEEAAMAEFVLEEQAGLAVCSLEEAVTLINEMTIEEYSVMKQNAERIGRELRAGRFLKNALSK